MLKKISITTIACTLFFISYAGKPKGFEGLYLGGALGYLTQDARFSGKLLINSSNLFRGDLGSSTVGGGADLRYVHNFQGGNYHLGFQLSGHLLGTHGIYKYLSGNGAAGNEDFWVHLKGRYMVGGAFHIGAKYKTSLPYGKIGLAVTRWEFNGQVSPGAGLAARMRSRQKSRHYPGLQLGFGTTFHMTNNVMVDYAFDYFLFQSLELNFPGNMKINTSPKIARISAALSYRW